jgi:hypothetical protein
MTPWWRDAQSLEIPTKQERRNVIANRYAVAARRLRRKHMNPVTPEMIDHYTRLPQ